MPTRADIAKRNRARRAVKARDVDYSHHVSENAGPMSRLHQMAAQHEQQRLLERELGDMAARLETPEDLRIWLGVAAELAVDTARVAEWVPDKLRAALPEWLRTAIEERIRARLYR
jgi:hypothetical protein